MVPSKKITTLDIEIAILEFFKVRYNLIVPNVSWGIANLHECDMLILSKSNYATEVEIKISMADLKRDIHKKHGHRHNHIARFFYTVPEDLQDKALMHIPDRAGLLICTKYNRSYRLKQVRNCIRNKKAHQWSKDERSKLGHLGAMHILGLKKKIANLM